MFGVGSLKGWIEKWMLEYTSVAGSRLCLQTTVTSPNQCKRSLLFKLSTDSSKQTSITNPLFLAHASEVRLIPNLHDPRRLAVHLGLHLLHVLGHLVHELGLVRPEDANGEERRVGGVVDTNRRDGDAALETCQQTAKC